MPPDRLLLLLSFVTTSLALRCYNDVQILAADEEVVYSENTTGVEAKSEICVVIRGHNDTHKLAERGAWKFERLPMECRAYGEHCFPKKESGWTDFYGCCCASDLCNADDEAIWMFHPYVINPSFATYVVRFIRALLCWFASMTVPIWVTIVVTIIYCWIMKALKKETVYDWDEEVLPERRELLNFDIEDSDNGEGLSAKEEGFLSARKMPSFIRPGMKASRAASMKTMTASTARSDGKTARRRQATEKTKKKSTKKKEPYDLDDTMLSHSLELKDDDTQASEEKKQKSSRRSPRQKSSCPMGGFRRPR